MSPSRKRWRSKAAALIATLALVLGANVAIAPPAHAAGYMHLKGYACPGGHIIQLIAVTTPESVYGVFAGTEWNVHLNKWDGDEHVNFAVKCNNNAWYFPIRHVTGYASPRWLGWI